MSMIVHGDSAAIHRSSTYTAMYSQHLKLGAFLSQMHGSALERVNFISLRILSMTSAHLLPEDLNPYHPLRKIRIDPSSSSNSGPATI